MGKLFGTDGVRGVANLELTAELAFKLGRYGAYVLTKNLGGKTTNILVGKDTRISGDMLECALVAGITSTGANAQIIGEIPTPAIAYLTKKYNADAGVVISASHNSFEYNGIKFFNGNGYKLSDEIENEIEYYILNKEAKIELPTHEKLGRVTRSAENAASDYINYAISAISGNYSGIKVALDCANGASSKVSPKAFEKLGCEVYTTFNTPDGVNINNGCGSTHINKLQEFVVSSGADIGFAFDGDADRLIAVDEKGETVDGDIIMGLVAKHLKKENKLKNNLLVATVMSNLGLFKFCEKEGIDVIQTKVGDRYVLEKMIETGAIIGGEQSGHIILSDYNTTGDGLVSALVLLSVYASSGKKLSELKKEIEIYPQVLVNVSVKNEYKSKLTEIDEVASFAEKITNKYAGTGRLLLRPSGTEPLVRIMIEGQNINEINEDAHALAEIIENAMKKL